MSTPAAKGALTWLKANAPEPSNAHETVALAIHALLLYHEFRPSQTAVTDGTNDGADGNSNETDTAGETSSNLPVGWGGAGYGGEYRHERSAMTFDIRGVRMGRRLVVHAAAGEDDSRMYTVDVRVDDFVAADGAPVTDGTEGTEEDSSQWHNLTRLDDLATLVAVQIAHRLVPDGAKRGYEDGASNSNAAGTDAPGTSSQRGPGNLGPAPGVGGFPPGYHPIPTGPEHGEDPLRIGPVRQPGPRFPGLPRMPDFGRDDLIHPGLDVGVGGRGMFGPGGNLMGPGHFGPNRFGPGRGRLPPGVPPGARFDPFGPTPDRDIERPPGFEDEHGLNGPPGGGGTSGGPMGGGYPRDPGDEGPPPGMFF